MMQQLEGLSQLNSVYQQMVAKFVIYAKMKRILSIVLKLAEGHVRLLHRLYGRKLKVKSETTYHFKEDT